MKLSEKEKEILAFITSQADATAVAISKALGIRTHSVHYALRRFHESNLIRRRVFVDTYKLGIPRYGLYLKCTPSGLLQLDKMFVFLSAHESVALVLLFQGAIDMEINIASRDFFSVQNFLVQLERRFPNAIQELTIAPQLYHSVFAGKGLSNRKYPDRSLCYGGQIHNLQIDETDHRILSSLCADNTSSARVIAQKLGIPISTFQYRVDKLKERDIIKGFTYVTDGQRLGKMHYLFLVTCANRSDDFRKAMEQFAWDHPEVTYYVEVLGPWQHELGVRVDNTHDAAIVRDSLTEHFDGKIQKIEILSSMRNYHVADYPFRKYPFDI